MLYWNPDLLLSDFVTAATHGGIELAPDAIYTEILPMPHQPPSSLPKGKSAVYIFSTNHCVLKVGQAGPKSNARYTSQPYNPDSAQSTLASSLLKDQVRWQGHNLNEENVPDWIKKNTHRVNYLLNADVPKSKWVRTLLEAFVQCRFPPVYEGRRRSESRKGRQ